MILDRQITTESHVSFDGFQWPTEARHDASEGNRQERDGKNMERPDGMERNTKINVDGEEVTKELEEIVYDVSRGAQRVG